MRDTTYTKLYDDVMNDDRLSLIEAIVFCKILSWKESTGYACPSVKTLATQCKCSIRSIVNTTNRLVELGLLVKNARFNSSNIYECDCSKLVSANAAGGAGDAGGGANSALTQVQEMQSITSVITSSITSIKEKDNTESGEVKEETIHASHEVPLSNTLFSSNVISLPVSKDCDILNFNSWNETNKWIQYKYGNLNEFKIAGGEIDFSNKRVLINNTIINWK